MPHPMSKYKIETVKHPKHSFVPIKGERKAYAKYGSMATYANIAQAEKKVSELRLLGYDCFRTYQWPFLILLNEEKTN